jgi:GDPmannose 4,6-dehydratase
VELLIGDPQKAKDLLGWAPATKFADLVKIMVDGDLAVLEGRPPEPQFTGGK